MDFPFEYVERLWDFPNLDTRTFRKKTTRTRRQRTVDYPESEEHERDAKRPELDLNVLDVREMQKKASELRDEVNRTCEKGTVSNIRGLVPGQKELIESEVDEWTVDEANLSVDDTSSDELDRAFPDQKKRERAIGKKFRTFHECACTDSACESAVPSPVEVSSESTSSESIEGIVESMEADEKMIPEEVPRLFMSTESSASSEDEEWGIDEEIKFLEQVLQQKLREEAGTKSPVKTRDDKKPNSTESAFDNIDMDETFSKMFSVMKREKEQISRNKPSRELGREEPSREQQSRVDSPSKLPPREQSPTKLSKEQGSREQETGVSQSTSSPETSSTLSSSESSLTSFHSNVTFNFSTPPLFSPSSAYSSDAFQDDGQPHANLALFRWGSGDLHLPSATDNELENDINRLDNTWEDCKNEFEKLGTTEIPNLEAKKLKIFPQPIPETIKNKRNYVFLEEAVTPRLGLIRRHTWLVQQIETGRICSAKLVSRKDPGELVWQKAMNNERKVLRELLPELSVQSHLAKLLDVGCDKDYKFLILEDVGTDFPTLYAEFGTKFDFATQFLFSFFTLSAVKELHYLGYLHLDLRPSSFSVIHNPFNIKIKSYGRVTKKTKDMKAPRDMRPDSFSPRIFHKKDKKIDEYADIEAWIYTMMFLSSRTGLQWFGKKDQMQRDKEELFNNLRKNRSKALQGCGEAVTFAANLLARKKMQYKDFMAKMDKLFAINVMQFADTDQPTLWRFHELQKVKKHFAAKPELFWDQEHWNPAFEVDSADEKAYEEKENQFATVLNKARQETRDQTTFRRKRWGDGFVRGTDEQPEQEQSSTSNSTMSSPSTKSSESNTNEDEEEEEEEEKGEEKEEEEKEQKTTPVSELSAGGSEMSPISSWNDVEPTSTSPVSISQFESGDDSESSSDIESTDSWASTWTSSSGSCSDALLLWGNNELQGPFPEMDEEFNQLEKNDFVIYQQLIIGAQEENGTSDSESGQDPDWPPLVFSSEDDEQIRRDEGLLVNMVQWKHRFHKKNFFRPRPKFTLKEPRKTHKKK